MEKEEMNELEVSRKIKRTTEGSEKKKKKRRRTIPPSVTLLDLPWEVFVTIYEMAFGSSDNWHMLAECRTTCRRFRDACTEDFAAKTMKDRLPVGWENCGVKTARDARGGTSHSVSLGVFRSVANHRKDFVDWATGRCSRIPVIKFWKNEDESWKKKAFASTSR